LRRRRQVSTHARVTARGPSSLAGAPDPGDTAR
jgi:hypothetical protein